MAALEVILCVSCGLATGHFVEVGQEYTGPRYCPSCESIPGVAFRFPDGGTPMEDQEHEWSCEGCGNTDPYEVQIVEHGTQWSSAEIRDGYVRWVERMDFEASETAYATCTNCGSTVDLEIQW